jgi:hypothetical protein
MCKGFPMDANNVLWPDGGKADVDGASRRLTPSKSIVLVRLDQGIRVPRQKREIGIPSAFTKVKLSRQSNA